MANYTILRRLNCIATLIKNNKNISKKVLFDRLLNDHDLELSNRTFDRDKINLAANFGVVIKYNPKTRGYVMEQNNEALLDFFKFAKFASMVEIYETGIKNYKLFQEWVLPEDSSGFMGVEHFKELIEAISLKRKLCFLKENYYGGTTKAYTVSPLCLKEYANRWYLIAVVDGETEIKNFGIDRLSKLKILKEEAKTITDLKKQLQQYDAVVGLNYSQAYTENIEKIVIKAHNKQIKYLRSLPIHKSQSCVDGISSNWGTVTYTLKPNYEFEIQILKLGNMIEVLEPKWFRDRIKKHITEMYNLYH